MEKANDEPERAPKLNGLVESTLFVENLPRAIGFYEKVLGLRKIQQSESGCVFRLDDQRYLLLFAHERAAKPNESPYGIVPPCAAPHRRAPGPGHIAFGISLRALELWRARLEKHHVEILSEITWQRAARSLYFRDPDGHLIELATPGIWQAPRTRSRRNARRRNAKR
jgi:catechol 2,3-dioxygenase-like lactoylglutathione lyase family enzyme